MCAPDIPDPPDPIKTAAGQTATNIGTAIANQFLNAPEQVTPDYELRYHKQGNFVWNDPVTKKNYKIPRRAAITKLRGDAARIKNLTDDAKVNIAGLAKDQSARLQALLGQDFGPDGARPGGDIGDIRDVNLARVGRGPSLQGRLGDAGDITRTYGTDFSTDRRRVERAMLSRLRPSIREDREALRTQLANQGIQIGSEAYTRAMRDFDQSANDARTGIILAGGQEQSRLADLEARRAGFENSAQAQAFGQELGRTSFLNTARQQGFANELARAQANNSAALQQSSADMSRFDAAQRARAQDLQERFAFQNHPINQITALLSGSQVSQPNFVNVPQSQIPTTDYAGIVNENYRQRLAASQAGGSGIGSALGGLFSLGSSLLSDRRFKKDIIGLGTLMGHAIYAFRYLWEAGTPRHVGVMAQEVEKTRPDAVTEINGVRFVNYQKLFGDCYA